MATFPVKKNFGLCSCGIEYNECQEKSYKGPEGLLTNIVQMIRSFLWYLKGRQK